MKAELKEIRDHPLFEGISDEHLVLMGECAMPVEFKMGEWVFREGEPANRFYLIHSGQVELLSEGPDHRLIRVDTLGRGDVLGWSWLFPPYYWHFGAKVVEPVHSTFFYGTRLREILEQYPELNCDIMQRFAQVLLKRLRATRQQLLRTVTGDPSAGPSREN